MVTCSIDACSAPVRARGLCGKHYQRLMRWGDTDTVRSKWPERTTSERFWSHVSKTDTCWLWTASIRNGYGVFWPADRMVMAHRFAYEEAKGAIPDGLDLDHLCRVRNCVRPSHLEPVTRHENVMRGDVPRALRENKCRFGHPFTDENTYVNPKGARICKTCRRAGEARYRERRRGQRWSA